MSWLDRFTWPREAITNLQGDVTAMCLVLLEIPTCLIRLEKIMTDISPLLNQLADDMSTWAAGPFAELLAENVAVKADNATLATQVSDLGGEVEGLRAEDASETSAAQRAVDGFNAFAAPVTESPEVPVEIPILEVPAEIPAEGSDPEFPTAA